MLVPVYDIVNCGPRHRFVADGGLVSNCNFQNFKRGSDLRRAIRAPAGYRIVKADKSQVECRFLCQLAGQLDEIEKFRSKQDPYADMASLLYGHEVYKPKEGDLRYDELLAKRGSGKQMILSAGYGCGAASIKATAARGTYGPPVEISLEKALEWRDLYRKTHPKVVRFWYEAEEKLSILEKPDGNTDTWNIFKLKDGKIILPNGTSLLYPELAYVHDPESEDTCYWQYRSRSGYRRIWGGFLVENLIQAVSRVDIGQCMLRLKAKGYRIVLMEHDAIAVLVEESKVDKCVQEVREEMTRSPSWCPDIPLDCEISVGETYS
jgi:DNA polymerase